MNRRIGVILSYVLMIFEVLSTLFLTPFIISSLGQAEYGVYKLAASINAYLLLLDLGVGNSIIRYISKYRAEGKKILERQFLGVATIYYTVVASIVVVCGIALIAAFPNIFAVGLTSEEIVLGQKLLGITMLNSAVTLGTAAYNNVIVAYEKFSISKGFSILQIILRIFLTFCALKAGLGSLGIVIVNLCLTILLRMFFVGYVIFRIRLVPLMKNIHYSFVKEIMVYSSFVLLQMVATQINATADQILLGALVRSSSEIIAVYGIGTQVVQYYQSIGSAFNGVMMPGIVRMVSYNSSSQEICNEMVRIGRSILMIIGIIWVAFLLHGRQFIILWAGIANEEAYYVTSILMTAYLFILTESVGSQVLWAKNEHREQALMKIAVVFLNIVLTVFLIKWKPLIGATVGTFLSLILGDVVVMNIIFAIKLKISLKQYYLGLCKGIAPCLFVTFILGSIISKLGLEGWTGFGLNIMCICIVYICVLWIFGMNSYEKQIMNSIFKLKKRK